MGGGGLDGYVVTRLCPKTRRARRPKPHIVKDITLLVALRDVRARAKCVCSGRLSVVGFYWSIARLS